MTAHPLPVSADNFLRRALLADSVFSALAGAACLAAGQPLAALMGLASPVALSGVAAVCAAYATGLALILRQRPIARPAALFVIVGNSAWAVASYLLLLSGWVAFTPAGWWLVAIQADLVAALAIAQYLGLRQREAAARAAA